MELLLAGCANVTHASASCAETKVAASKHRRLEDPTCDSGVLLQSTGVGKTLAKLRKAGPEELRNTADILVTKWKQAVEGTAVEAAKRPRWTS